VPASALARFARRAQFVVAHVLLVGLTALVVLFSLS
jgi:hypothetical protein